MASGRNLSKTFVWIILGLLIVGLAGFGATNLGGTIRTIGVAGNESISVNEYMRELQSEMRRFEAQTGQPMPIAQAQALGLDQAVLARLVALASLDNEVGELGISVGDENLQKEIIELSSFQGLNGEFDRETYRFALNQAGVSEIEFENDLRAESARTLVQGAVMAGVEMPPVMIDTIVNYVGARRSFVWAQLGAPDLTTPIGEPTDTELRAYYDENPAPFTLPETKRLSYVWLSPEMILDQIEVDQDALRQAYDERSAQYNIPERRLVERLVFADAAEAGSAMAQIEVGGATFETLVQNRGLSLGDVDLGDVTIDDLDDAATTVFAATAGDIVGPLPTTLGPALFRINGILKAQTTTFQQASAQLRDELAADRARRMIETQAQDIDDLLAGGATLEELAGESDMQAGQIDWTSDTSEGIAAYGAFREAATAVTDSDFPAIVFLDDGGIFALQLDEVLAPRPEPFEDARSRVVAGWTLQATENALREQATGLIANLTSDGSFAAAGLTANVETGLTRTAYIDATPADFLIQVFNMNVGELSIVGNGGTVLVVRLDAELAPDQTPELESLRTSFATQLNQTLSQELFNAFVQDAQLRASPQIDQRALNAVQASFQ